MQKKFLALAEFDHEKGKLHEFDFEGVVCLSNRIKILCFLSKLYPITSNMVAQSSILFIMALSAVVINALEPRAVYTAKTDPASCSTQIDYDRFVALSACVAREKSLPVIPLDAQTRPISAPAANPVVDIETYKKCEEHVKGAKNPPPTTKRSLGTSYGQDADFQKGSSSACSTRANAYNPNGRHGGRHGGGSRKNGHGVSNNAQPY